MEFIITTQNCTIKLEYKLKNAICNPSFGGAKVVESLGQNSYLN